MGQAVVMTLTDFLLARISEDEARVAGEWFGDGDADPDFMWGPNRIKAECQAKRRIVEVVGSWRHEVVEDCWYTCGAATEERDGGQCCDELRRGTGCDCGLDFRVRSILVPLALPYADHPDYVSAVGPAPLTTNETREDT